MNIVAFIKNYPNSKVYIHLFLNTVLLPEWPSAVLCIYTFILFSDSYSWVPCLSWTACCSSQNPLGPKNYLVFQHFCVFKFFSTMSVWFWGPSFNTEDNCWTHMQLLQMFPMRTDALEQRCRTLLLAIDCPAKFSSNSKQSHLKQLIKVFRIAWKLKTCMFD